MPEQRAAANANRILVVGSYPPVGTPGAVATLAAVRRAVADGDDPVVVSPRPSAAHYAVAMSGVFAGRRLDNLRRMTGAGRLVLCAERDLPLPTRFGVPALLGLAQRATLAEVRRAARGFEHVTLVMGDDLGVAVDLVTGLRGVAGEVVELEGRPAGDPGVTVLGPHEHSPTEQLTNLTRKAARIALGPLYPTVRRLGAGAIRRGRAAATPGARRLGVAIRGRPRSGPRR
jgi:hypothetical protein